MTRTGSSFKPGRYATIDIGTVTARLLVADINEQGQISELAKDMAICNLGVGVDKTSRLAAEAIDRVEATVRRFVETIESLQPESKERITVIANATSASRDAENADEFVDRMAALGIKLQVIPGQREAALSFAGATSAFPGARVVVIDVGGGSTEIIAGDAGSAPVHAHSFNIGCRRVTERYFETDPPSAESIAAAGEWISASMADYLATLKEEGFFEGKLVAVAGTATSIISMREEMEVYDSSRVHGAVATRAEIDEMLGKLAAMTLEQRKNVVGLNPGRAPVIVAGVLIIQQIMQAAGAMSFTASERDILHGILLDAASC